MYIQVCQENHFIPCDEPNSLQWDNDTSRSKYPRSFSTEAKIWNVIIHKLGQESGNAYTVAFRWETFTRYMVWHLKLRYKNIKLDMVCVGVVRIGRQGYEYPMIRWGKQYGQFPLH